MLEIQNHCYRSIGFYFYTHLQKLIAFDVCIKIKTTLFQVWFCACRDLGRIVYPLEFHDANTTASNRRPGVLN